tara:strand:+ start:1769 stop:2047 length:279 start_codon:yes stop_codon:yes gene_type:complete
MFAAAPAPRLQQSNQEERSPAIQQLHKAQLAVIAAQRLSKVEERYSVLSAVDEATPRSTVDADPVGTILMHVCVGGRHACEVGGSPWASSWV